MSRSRRLRADGALLGVAAVWGATFVMVKDAVALVGPLTFLAIRFVFATVVLAAGLAIAARRRPAPPRPGWRRASALVGLFLFLGYLLQTAGLQHTSASRAGFLTGLSVVMVPFVAWAWLRRRPRAAAVLGAAVAIAGLALLTLPGAGAGPPPNRGDVLVLGCALAFALHIAAVGRVAAGLPPLALAGGQVATAAALSILGAFWLERPDWPLAWQVWAAALFTGVVATALAFWVQSSAQAFTSPERTALIFATEPVFAALFGFWLAGEALGGLGWAGGALIVAGMVVSEWRPRRTRP